MHSIMITNKCNNNCKYCFAKSTYCDDFDFISIEDFKYALNFLSKTFNSIGIIGGEPTLHPHFKEILEIIVHNSKINQCVIYTNGYNLKQYIDIINNKKFILLINCNSPQDIGSKEFKKLEENVLECSKKLGKSFNSKIRLGFNLYKPNQNYRFIIDLLKQTKQNNLRFAITVPNNVNNKHKFSLIDFHKSIKYTMLEIFEELQKINVIPHFDCNAFPNCLLDENNIKFFNQIQLNAKKQGIETNLLNDKKICTPQIVVRTNLSAIRCFASGDYNKVNIKDFKNATELYRHFYLNMDIFQHCLFADPNCLNCKDRLINCNICSGYNIIKNENIKQYCLKLAEE